MRENADLITSAQAARILACVPDNVRKLAREGKLPVAGTVGRGQRLFERGDIERLAKTRGTSGNEAA